MHNNLMHLHFGEFPFFYKILLINNIFVIIKIMQSDENEEFFKKKLLEEIDQLSNYDSMTERSFIMENNIPNDFNNSRAWLEFMEGNKQRDIMI